MEIVARDMVARNMAATTHANGNSPSPAAFMAMPIGKMWQNGQTLKCRFLDGSTKQQKKVQKKAEIWEEHANIKFKFIKTGDAEIRISFGFDSGSWSAVGTDAMIERYFPKYQPTMNFGWLEDDTADKEYGRVVVHEFGHALGCIHEHQSPSENLKWDKAAVYRYFSGPPNNWSKSDIDHNVLQRYSKKNMAFTRFDIDSIMLYMFPAELFTDHKGTPQNVVLSKGDKAFIAQQYPKSGGKTSAHGAKAHAKAAMMAF